MQEELLHYIWQQKNLLALALTTTQNKPIKIVKPGLLNTNAGPDFFDARIEIDNTLWAGNVEIHVKSSDWLLHKHQQNQAFNNVILHVVYEHDVEVGLPTLELKKWLPQNTLAAYQQLQQAKTKIPCQNILRLPSQFVIGQFLQRLAIERLENKCTQAENDLTACNQSWEKLFYLYLAKYFGMKVNAEPFMCLAQNLPATILAKHKHQKNQIFALVFGVAGFLKNNTNPGIAALKAEFATLQVKYNLHEMDASVWKFARTRPVNFPTVRLIQFAELIYQSNHLFSKIIEANSLENIVQLLQVNPVVEPWHSQLHQAVLPKQLKPGNAFLYQLVINAVAPIKFIYGKHQLNSHLCDNAINLLETCKPETNAIVAYWKALGVKPKTALESQGILQLNQHYCLQKRCLSCTFGHNILSLHENN